MLRLVTLFATIFAIVACAESPEPLDDSNVVAPGVNTRADTLDPALVGHRLMAAGEYELALKSYYRAAARQGLTPQILASMGTANLALKRLGQAEELLRDATEADEEYVPAWNNLGVVLMEKREWGEAARVFQIAFALDSGETADIQQNLTLALANLNQPSYSEPEEAGFSLVRRGSGDYLLMSTE